jgi:hypothetical protein
MQTSAPFDFLRVGCQQRALDIGRPWLDILMVDRFVHSVLRRTNQRTRDTLYDYFRATRSADATADRAGTARPDQR